MRMFAITLLALGLVPSGIAGAQQPQDWVEVVRHPSGPIWIDRNSVTREGDFVTVMSRSDFDPPRADGTRAFRVRFRYDCANRTADLLYFEQIGSDGRVTLSSEIGAGDRQVEPIPPNSPNATIAARLCT